MLPPFKMNSGIKRWIASEQVTGRAVRLLWNYTSERDHTDPEFLLILMRCAWVNGDEGPDDASRRLRNRHLATWLGLDQKAAESDLIKALVGQLGMPVTSARWFVSSIFGITHYYSAFRGYLKRYVVRHQKEIGAAFKSVAQRQEDPTLKAYAVADRIFRLPTFKVATGKTSIVNAASPALACLDPQHRFPILNQRTKRLLAALGEEANASGAQALSKLVGKWGLKTAFHVDVYSQTYSEQFEPLRRSRVSSSKKMKTLGIQSEEESVATYEKRKVTIRKRHVALLNKLTILTPPFTVQVNLPFDAVVHEYRKGRKLLIEAKSETVGVLGRSQMRQAIGQLFDYRWREFSNERDKVDLALLTPSKPPQDMLDLLEELEIEALWFSGKSLAGTIKLK